MKTSPLPWVYFGVIICLVSMTEQHENKYSAEANKKDDTKVDFRTLNKPFRMAKLNLLWTKAQVRLTEPKLKSLFSDLKIQDKEELAHKRFKGDGSDKDGLKEAELRKKLIGIMSSYDLLEHFEDVHNKVKLQDHHAMSGSVDDYINRSLFKDKKLNKLWVKAEMSGFNSDELQLLKQEFSHHQDKIDQYYSILGDVQDGKTDQIYNAMDNEDMEKFNTLESDGLDNDVNNNKDYLHKANLLREKHRDLRDGYDRLYRMAAKGPRSKEFIEPKVQQLWHVALQGDFKPAELDSLRVELQHYEGRLLKLRHLQAEHVSNSDKIHAKIAETGSKPDIISQMEENIKKQMRKVEKLHLDIETRILERHSEL